MKFKITETCVKCGACMNDCPEGAISEQKTQFKIEKKCIKCGDCYTICPVGAIDLIDDEKVK